MIIESTIKPMEKLIRNRTKVISKTAHKGKAGVRIGPDIVYVL
jgi:hypothetical protein